MGVLIGCAWREVHDFPVIIRAYSRQWLAPMYQTSSGPSGPLWGAMAGCEVYVLDG